MRPTVEDSAARIEAETHAPNVGLRPSTRVLEGDVIGYCRLSLVGRALAWYQRSREQATVSLVRIDPSQLSEAATQFLAERHLATFSSVRADGSPHVVPVGFTWDPATRLARVITDGGSVKARRSSGPVALCQVDGRRWLTLQGTSTVSADPARVADAVARYAIRYRQPRVNPTRVVIEVAVQSVLIAASLQ